MNTQKTLSESQFAHQYTKNELGLIVACGGCYINPALARMRRELGFERYAQIRNNGGAAVLDPHRFLEIEIEHMMTMNNAAIIVLVVNEPCAHIWGGNQDSNLLQFAHRVEVKYPHQAVLAVQLKWNHHVDVGFEMMVVYERPRVPYADEDVPLRPDEIEWHL